MTLYLLVALAVGAAVFISGVVCREKAFTVFAASTMAGLLWPLTLIYLACCALDSWRGV